MSERIWDRFLTAQDRSLAANRPRKQIGFGQQPALLLVDLYRWVFGDKPELFCKRSGPGREAAGSQIQALLKTARESRDPNHSRRRISRGRSGAMVLP